jgi:hypothetical protein
LAFVGLSLLELCCRVASADHSGETLAAFGSALERIEPRYYDARQITRC